MGKSIYTRLNTIEFNRKNCAKLFGEQHSIPPVASLLEYYGNGTFKQDRIIWINGEIDPWRYLGFTDISTSTPEQPVVMHSAFHCSDLYNGMIKGTQSAVTEIFLTFDQWFKSS